MCYMLFVFFFFSSRRRHTRLQGDWSSDVCSSDLKPRWWPRKLKSRQANGTCCAISTPGTVWSVSFKPLFGRRHQTALCPSGRPQPLLNSRSRTVELDLNAPNQASDKVVEGTPYGGANEPNDSIEHGKHQGESHTKPCLFG